MLQFLQLAYSPVLQLTELEANQLGSLDPPPKGKESKEPAESAWSPMCGFGN